MRDEMRDEITSKFAALTLPPSSMRVNLWYQLEPPCLVRVFHGPMSGSD